LVGEELKNAIRDAHVLGIRFEKQTKMNKHE